jgi:hypothetical protein
MNSGAQRQIVEGRDAEGRTFATIQIPTESNQKPTPSFVDLRKPQNGLALRTFRKRHPLRKSPQREIINSIRGALANVPGPVVRSEFKKTPIRDSGYGAVRKRNQ